MSATVPETQYSPPAAVAGRRIVRRSKGSSHGPITRLFSPGDLGQILKPFVFLDLFDMVSDGSGMFGFHPHSGIATVTTVFEGDTAYEDSTGKSGVLLAHGVEWMQAGRGVWHTAKSAAPGRARGYQLWLALPDALELAAPHSEYVSPGEVPRVGPARVILGRYDGVSSVLPMTSPLTYLHVQLEDGESWRFTPPTGQDVAWLAVDRGSIAIGQDRVEREVVVFEPGEAPITLRAIGQVSLMIGAAAHHPHALVLGHYSVHTSEQALHAGEAGIEAERERLRRAGKL